MDIKALTQKALFNIKTFTPKVLCKVSLLEKGLCYISLFFLALIPFTDLVLRNFNLPIPHAKGLISHLFLVAAFVSAMLTAKSKEHISISAIQYIKNEKIKQVLVFIGVLDD